MAAGTAMTLETLRVEIRAEIQKYKTDLKKAETATTSSANKMKTALQAVRTALGAIGIVTGLMAAITKIVQLGKESLELASDLQEVQNVVDVTFGSMSDQIDEFATNAITQFGLSQTAAKQYASTIGAMLKSMGFRGQELTDMSMNLAGLAADLASFYNLDTDTAFAKIRAGISGETEPLKQLGINLSVANLEAFALSQGITTAYNAMTQQEQAMLRYNYLLQATADAQGDFSRTSDGWANQVRVMREQINAIKAEIGSGLMEILLPIVRGINWLLAQVIKGIQAIRRFFHRGGGVANVTNNSMETAVDTTDSLASAANAASSAVGGIGKAARSAARAFTNASFDELHQLTNPNSGSGGGGGGGGAGAFEDLLDESLWEEGTRAAGGFSGAVDDAADTVGGFWQMVDKTKRNWEAARRGLEAYNEAYLEFGTEVGERVANFVQTKWIPAQEAAQVGMDAYDEAVRNAWSDLKGKLRPILTTVGDKLRGFVTGSAEAQEGIRRFNEASVNGFHDLAMALGLVSDDADNALAGMDSATVKIKDDLAKLATDKNLKEFSKSIGDLGVKAGTTADNVGTAGSAIREHIRLMNVNASKPISELRSKETGIGTDMTSAATTVKNGANNVVSSMTTMRKNAGSEADALRSTLVSKLNEAAKSASNEGGNIKNSIVNAIASTKSQIPSFWDVGANIKNGLIAGMGDFKGQLDQWASQFKSRILQNFKIKSPSRWMRDEVGWYLGLGMAEGMNDSERRILETCDGIATAMAGSFMSSIPSLSPMVSGVTGGGWVDHMASTIAQNMSSGSSQERDQTIVCEVYLDRDRIASAVSKGQAAQNRRYSSMAMA